MFKIYCYPRHSRANALVTEAEVMLNKALNEKGTDTPVSFPNTAYYLPTILA